MLPSARPARRAPASLSAGPAGSRAGTELLVRGRFRGTGRRPLPEILTKPCAVPAPALSSERCLISANAAARVTPLRPPPAGTTRPPQPALPPRSGGRGPRGTAGGEVRARRTIPPVQKLQYPAGRGEAALGCPRLASAESGAAAAGEAGGTIGRPRTASLGSQGAKGRWAFARFASPLAGRAGVGDKPGAGLALQGCAPCRERAWSGGERRSRPAGREHARRRPPAGTGPPSGRAGCTMSAASSPAGPTASMPEMLVSRTGRTWDSSGRSCAR